MSPSELESGTKVYFKIGTGTVFVGTVLDRDQLQKEYTKHSDSDNLVQVNIDTTKRPSSDETPSHMAPDKFQELDSTSDQRFRDAYTIDADIQTYRLTQENLVKVLD
mgnify:CR=1 FL=1